MKNHNLIAIAVTAALSMGISSFATAVPLECSSSGSGIDRTWTFDAADACGTGPGNPNSSADIEALGGVFDLGADDWANDDTITTSGGSSDWLTVTLTSGSWGGKDIEATWELADNFWENFGMAVFTVHVGGNPQNAPDDFGAFFITQGEYSGTWTFLQDPNEGGGGGLSNARLWFAGDGEIENPREVPEPGILVLFGTALMGLGLSRKRKA
ncbi:MAG: PEP-CTERM sorting domain-containing protein [Pseudomonadota bacterium]